MRRILSLIATLFVSVVAIAQNTDNQFQVETRGTAGLDYSIKGDDAQLSLFVISGAQVKPKTILGVGIAFPFMADIKEDDEDKYKHHEVYREGNTVYYREADCQHESGFDKIRCQVFLDYKYLLYDKSITPFIETTFGIGGIVSNEIFVNGTAALGIKVFPGNFAFIYDLYFRDKPCHLFGIRYSATWGKGIFTRK